MKQYENKRVKRRRTPNPNPNPNPNPWWLKEEKKTHYKLEVTLVASVCRVDEVKTEVTLVASV